MSIDYKKLDCDSLILLIKNIKDGVQPVQEINDTVSNHTESPLFPRRVNIEISNFAGFFYRSQVFKVNGYVNKDSKDIEGWYFQVEKKAGLIEALNKDLGGCFTTTIDIGDSQNEPTSYIWNYRGYTVELEIDVFVFSSKPSNHYLFSITKGHPYDLIYMPPQNDDDPGITLN